MDTPSLPLSELSMCRLTIKNGDALTPCRNKAAPVDFVFRVADGWHWLMATVEERFERKLPGQWSSDLAVLLKCSKGAAQKDYVRLCHTPDAFVAQIRGVWHGAHLTSEGQAGFVLMLFVYVPKGEQPITLRRVTATRIQEQMPRVPSLLEQHGIATGGAAHTYTAVTQARMREGIEMQLPDNATFDQLRHIDVQQAAIDARVAASQQEAGQEYVVIRVKIEHVPVPLQVNIADLRSALGLPGYRLCPPFRAPGPVSVPSPAHDMLDVDHMDTEGS